MTNRLTQPEEMKTRAYVYGVEKLNGYDAWALFQACAVGDLLKAKSLLAKDRRLVNAQHWYQFPIHKAASAGHTIDVLGRRMAFARTEPVKMARVARVIRVHVQVGSHERVTAA